MTQAVLVFGYGNPSRGDDAVGVLLLDWLQHNAALDNIALLSDFQLQIEHALDLQHRELVLFVDASLACPAPFAFSQLTPAQDNSYSSHAMSPMAVLHTYQQTLQQLPPPSFLLRIAASEFELGADLSLQTQRNLQEACEFTKELLENARLTHWQVYLN
jgi:hydrogenase maturation protease